MNVVDIKPKNTIERNAGSFQANSTTWSSATTIVVIGYWGYVD